MGKTGVGPPPPRFHASWVFVSCLCSDFFMPMLHFYPTIFVVPNKELLQVKSLKLDMEGAGSDNQVKDLEQKLAAKQSEVDEALYRMQR